MSENRRRSSVLSRTAGKLVKYDTQNKNNEISEPDVENVTINELFDSENYEFLDVDISEYEQSKGHNSSPVQVIEIDDDDDMASVNNDQVMQEKHQETAISFNLDLTNTECDTKNVTYQNNIMEQSCDSDNKFYVDFIDCNISSEAINEIILGNTSLGESERSSIDSLSENEVLDKMPTTERTDNMKEKNKPLLHKNRGRVTRKRNARKTIRRCTRQLCFPLEEQSNINNKQHRQTTSPKKRVGAKNQTVVKERRKVERKFKVADNVRRQSCRIKSENFIHCKASSKGEDVSKAANALNRSKINKPTKSPSLALTNVMGDVYEDVSKAVKTLNRSKINKPTKSPSLAFTNEMGEIKEQDSTRESITNKKSSRTISNIIVKSDIGIPAESNKENGKTEIINMEITKSTRILNKNGSIPASTTSNTRMVRKDYGEKGITKIQQKNESLEVEELSDNESIDRKISEIYEEYKQKRKNAQQEVVTIDIDSDSEHSKIVKKFKEDKVDNNSKKNSSASSYDCKASVDSNIDCSRMRYSLRNICKRGGSMSPTTKVIDFWKVDLKNAENETEVSTVESQFFDAPWPPTGRLHLDTDSDLSGHSDFFRIRAENPEIDKRSFYKSTALNEVEIINSNNAVIKNNLKIDDRTKKYVAKTENSDNNVSDIAVRISYNKGNISTSYNNNFVGQVKISTSSERNKLVKLAILNNKNKNVNKTSDMSCRSGITADLNTKQAEDFFKYLKIDKRRPHVLKRDLASCIRDVKRRSLRMLYKNRENTITEEKPKANVATLSINAHDTCKTKVMEKINSNMSVAEVLERLQSENTNKSDIVVVNTYSKSPDTELNASFSNVIVAEDKNVEKMIKVCYNKVEKEDDNLSLIQTGKNDNESSNNKSDICNNSSDEKSDVKDNTLNFKSNVETRAQISLKMNKNIHKTMIKTLASLKKHPKFSRNLNIKRDTKKKRIRRSSRNNNNQNKKLKNRIEHHLETPRKAITYFTSKKYKCKHRNLSFNIVKLRSGKVINAKIKQIYHDGSKDKNKRKSIEHVPKNLKNSVQAASPKDVLNNQISKEISQNVNKISNNFENITPLKTSPKKILDFSGEIKLGQCGIQIKNNCNDRLEISSSECPKLTENKIVVEILPDMETQSTSESNLDTSFSSESNCTTNEDDSGIVSDEEPNDIENEESFHEINYVKKDLSDTESLHNIRVPRVRSHSFSAQSSTITNNLKRFSSGNINNRNEVDTNCFAELNKAYEKKLNLYSLASRETKEPSFKLSLQNLAQDFDKSDTIENILHRNNIIVVIRTQTVCFYEHENSSTFFSSPKYWILKGKVRRYNPVKECRLTQVTNSIFYCSATCTLAYVEFFGTQRPVHTAHSSLLCEVTAAIYSFELNSVPQMSLVHIDYPRCLFENVLFTVIPWERAVVLGYKTTVNHDEFVIKKYVINDHYRSVQKSYSLTTADFHCTNLHSIDDDIIIGFGNGQVVLWNHLTQQIIFTINKKFVEANYQPRCLLDDLFNNTVCVWTRLDSIMDTLHLLLYCKLKSYLALVLIQKNRKQYTVLHKYYVSEKYNKILDATIGQYKLVINFEEGALAYDFPLDFKNDSSHVLNLKIFPPCTIFPNDRYVVHLENNVALSMTVDRL